MLGSDYPPRCERLRPARHCGGDRPIFCPFQCFDLVHQAIHARSERLVGCGGCHVDTRCSVKLVGAVGSARSQRVEEACAGGCAPLQYRIRKFGRARHRRSVLPDVEIIKKVRNEGISPCIWTTVQDLPRRMTRLPFCACRWLPIESPGGGSRPDRGRPRAHPLQRPLRPLPASQIHALTECVAQAGETRATLLRA